MAAAEARVGGGGVAFDRVDRAVHARWGWAPPANLDWKPNRFLMGAFVFDGPAEGAAVFFDAWLHRGAPGSPGADNTRPDATVQLTLSHGLAITLESVAVLLDSLHWQYDALVLVRAIQGTVVVVNHVPGAVAYEINTAAGAAPVFKVRLCTWDLRFSTRLTDAQAVDAYRQLVGAGLLRSPIERWPAAVAGTADGDINADLWPAGERDPTTGAV
jgi:hypothetical protein